MREDGAHVILNVDDDEAFLRTKSKILTRAGHHVIEAKCGGEALRLAASDMPDLMLLDVKLPDIPGTEVCRRLKTDPATAHIMVLQLSRETGRRVEMESLEGGADGYLTEPMEPNELAACVNALLRLHSLETENRRLIQQLRHEKADREGTERQLRETEQRYRLIAEMAHQGMWLIDRRGRTLFANRHMADMLGCSREELGAKSFYDFCFPRDVAQAKERIAGNFQGSTEQFEFCFRRSDGSPMLVLGETCPFRDGEGEPSGALIVFADITTKKQAENRLRESRERLQYALDSADMVAWDWNPDTDVMIQSSNACRILGLPEGTTLRSGKEYFALMHEEDEPRVVAAIQRALRAGSDYHEEFRVVLRDGSVRWVADRGRVTMSDHGKAARMNGVIRDITELKMREIAVRESEARFRAMFHQAAVGMCLISPEGHLLQVNQKLCVLLDEEADDLIHRKLLDLTHPEDRPHNQLSMSRLLLGGVADASIEQRLVRRDGDSVWVSMYLGLLWDAGGRLEHIIGVIQDIDERKRAEEALRESDRRFREMIDALPAAIYTTDVDGRLTHFNPAAVELSGRTPLLGTDHWCVSWKLYRPDGTPLPHEECPMAIALKENRIVRGAEAIGERPDGTRVWFTPYPTPLRDSEGRVVGGINMLVDITERKKAEEALRESESRFRTIADTAPAMLWKTDASGSCTFLSRAWYDFTGQTPDTGLDHSRFSQVHSDDRERVQRLFQAATAQREPFAMDYRLRRADGEYRWVSDSGRPRVSSSGEFQGYIGSVIDITERKQAEKQLHLLNADLERRVADRTRDLVHSQNRLRKLASDLSVAEERERRRVAGELHDYLAQLLVATRMKLSQGRQARSSAKQAEALSEVDHMLDQSLTYTRTLVAQLSPPVLHEFGLPAALKWLSEQMPRHGLTVTSKIDAAPVDLTENQAVLLFQSVRELLLNVAKHASTDRARLELEFQHGALRLTVEDDGQGFDASALKEAAVFKNAFGLFSIRERMESLGGMVEVTSRVGQGARVTLIMPLTPKTANEEFATTTSRLGTRNEELGVEKRACDHPSFNIPHSSFQQQLSKFRVLLVDDHAMVRQGLRSLLENHRDVEVIAEAGDGLQAIALTDKLRPDVVVMDLSLPSIDGVEATRQICLAHPSTVVIGLSVHQSHQVEQAIRAAGAAAFLTKDCAVDQLYEAMSSAMMARST